MQPITILGACLCFWVLYLKYRSRRKDRLSKNPKQRLRSVKLLLAAFVAWMALSFTLQHMMAKIDGPDTRGPSLMERVISFLL
jgi:hypothetical protein